MEGRTKITLTPLGSKIKFFVRGSRLWCSGMQNEIRRSMTLNKNDWVFRNVLGSELNIKKFLDKGKPKTIVTSLSNLLYDSCDSAGRRSQP